MQGIFDIINIPFAYVIRFFDSITGNYLLTLLFFAVVIKIVLFPFGIKQQRNMVKQASLRPKEQAIRNKYAGRNDKVTQQKVNEEVMALYKKEGFNPAGGCLPMVVQLIIVWAVYQIVYAPMTYIMRLSSENIDMIRNFLTEHGSETAEKAREIMLVGELRADKFGGIITDITKIPGMVLGKGAHGELPNFNVFGSFGDLSDSPSLGNINWLWIIPLLVLVSTFLSMKLTRKFSYQAPQAGGTDMGKSMKIMDFTMPLFSLAISFSMPAAIGVYWIFQSVLGVGQQYLLSKIMPIPTFTEEELRAFEKEYGATSNRQKKKQERAKVRSLHHIDDDDYDSKGNMIINPASSDDTNKLTAAKSEADHSEKTEKAEKSGKKSVSGIDQAPMQDEDDR